MEVTTPSADPSVTITRPANVTAYTAGDVIGQADTSVAANAGDAIHVFDNVPVRAVIHGATLRIDLATIPAGMTTLRLHLYSSAPDAILDNAAWDLSSATNRGAYQGYIEFTPADLGSSLWSQVSPNLRVTSSGGRLYGLLVTTAGYTPTSGEVMKVTLNARAV
jgi:hypothetical protein